MQRERILELQRALEQQVEELQVQRIALQREKEAFVTETDRMQQASAALQEKGRQVSELYETAEQERRSAHAARNEAAALRQQAAEQFAAVEIERQRIAGMQRLLEEARLEVSRYAYSARTARMLTLACRAVCAASGAT